jgi:hypothetical protein
MARAPKASSCLPKPAPKMNMTHEGVSGSN